MALITVEQGLSFVQYEADGVTTQYPLIFDYIDQDHIKVFIGNTEVTYTWINASTITPDTAAVSGDIVTVRRFTPNDARLVDFQDGGQLSEALLDKDSTQMFYLAQESADTVNFNLTLDPLLQVVDFRSNRGINLATPINPTDAANKDYVDDELSAIQSSVASAVSTANAASAAAVVAANDAAAAAASAAAVEGIAQSAVDNVTAHISNTTDAHDASAISVVASNGMVSTQVQAALDEHQGDINTISGDVSDLDTALAGHLSDTSPHDTIIGSSIQTPSRLDVKQGTEADLITYATTASNGQIVFATDSKELFQIIDGELAPIGAGGISLWVTAEPYEVNDVVIESDKIYRCIELHTSGTFATDLAANKWTEVSSLPQALAPTDSPEFVDVELTGKLLSAVVQATSSAGVQIKNAAGTTVLDVGPSSSTNSSFVGSVNVGGNLAVTGNISALNYQNKNLLINPDFEGTSITDWTCTGNTCTRTTTANEYLIGSAALKVVLGGNVLDVKQTVTTNAAQLSGVQMVASIWVKSDDVSDIRLCSMKNGSEDKCTVTGGYVQGSGWRQLTVSFLGDSTSNGLKLKSTDTTGTVLVDQAYVGIGSPVVDFTPDMVYSAKVSGAGAISNENTDWLSSCTIGGSGSASCTYTTGLVSQPMNCEAGFDNANSLNQSISVSSSSSTGFTVQTSAGGAFANLGFYIICQKQGADYKTSKAYVASSSDYGYTNAGAITITATTTNPTKGTIVTDRVFASRDGQRLKATYQYDQTTGGSNGSGEYLFSLPSGLSFDSSFVGFYTGAQFGASENKAIVGWGKINTGSNTSTFVSLVAYDSTRFRVYAVDSTSVRGYIGSAYYNLSGAVGLGFNLDAPISGWTDSGVIVGSFQGYNETPGTSRVETFSVSYGTTNATTVCSASPCSYLDQIGNAVTSVTRSTTGTYSLNTSKTYSKLKCTWAVGGATPQVAYSASGFGCVNCSALSFKSLGTATTADADSWGTILCQGTPQ